jgi:hypothetical protein
MEPDTATQPREIPVMTKQPIADTGCCPRFDPEPWQDQEISWRNKPFIKDHVRAFFHVPFNVGRMFAKEQALIESSGARDTEGVVLSDESSLWGADYYFAVSKDVPGADMAKLSGTYLTKVFNGPYWKVSDWMEEMRDYAAARGKDVEHFYCWYTTCPQCAKAYGENYVVLFAEVG